MHKFFLFLMFFVLFFTSDAFANRFDIAHVREQGQNMIVIPLNSRFHFKSKDQKNQTMSALQRCASGAKLAGTVVLIWENNDRISFMAPTPWHSFFRSVDMLWVAKRINKTLTCR